MPATIRPLAVALALCGTLFAGAAACGGSGVAQEAAAYIAVATPSPSTPVERRKFARTRFATNAGFAAGATSQWIVKPWKSGTFKKGAEGRTAALVKAGLAGAFAQHRLEAAVRGARGDPALARAVAPLTSGIDALKGLTSRLRKGDPSAVGSFQDAVKRVKRAGRSAGTPVMDKVPSPARLTPG
ncbi:hypothetical protein ACFSL4_17495 [Streptomyces caeni]|uniref:Uncharacterized protein n=1 Tax=Streptomyces caeni TaxID=2307231 RepID=A0ABW4IRH1_9ACTN